ncbi:dockerin type I domain-containing protein [Petroclostridium sp. X23]|uniref:dockerin type I domain-containing protein n=1 Tax=Petroclostridium sp. X23 TaxID=3045146 RepID=UPI0024AD9531|nr:dockerin type I domain-containing protein [Petroclostridium sp. X23]WHH61339.1 dockerin type I domain-containing protein [Petroclostridium sp. X23]
MKRILLSIILVSIVFLSGCSSFHEKTSSSSKQIVFDLNKYEDLERAKLELEEKVFEYFENNPIIRDNYFPLKGNNEVKVKIKDSKIDFSGYKLDGDVNSDGAINEKDLGIIMEKFLNSSKEKEFDLNNDGNLSTQDIQYVCDRILTEVVTFGFYDKDGKKTGIPAIPFGSKQIVNIKEYPAVSLKEGDDVTVVPEDVNGASTRNVPPPPGIGQQEAIPELEEIVETLINQLDVTPEKYLVGWSASIQAIGRSVETSPNTKAANVLNEGILTPYLSRLTEAFKSKVEALHFKYHMKYGVKYIEKPHRWQASAGIHFSNFFSKGYKTDVESINKTQVISHTTQDGGRTVKRIIAYRSTIMYTDYSSPREGTLEVAGWGNVFGDLEVQRVGPGKGHDDIKNEVKVEKGHIPKLDPLYTGDYRVTLKHEDCGLNMVLDEDHVYRHDEDYVFNVKIANKVKVTGKAIDKITREPLKNKKVELISKCPKLNIEKIEPEMTNNAGSFTFNDVPYGIYELKIDDEYIQDVKLENAKETHRDLGDVMQAGTFDIEFTYKNNVYEYEVKAKWKDVEIDRDGKAGENGFKVLLDGLDNEENVDEDEAYRPELSPDEYKLNVRNPQWKMVYDDPSEPVPVTIKILQASEKGAAIQGSFKTINFEPGAVFVEITENFDVRYSEEPDFELGPGFTVPLFSRLITHEDIKNIDPRAGIDDGCGLGYSAKVDKEKFMSIFSGETFERKGAGRTSDGIGDEYRLVIKPHEN